MVDFGENHRIVDMKLDEKNVVKRSPEIEHERAVAMYDLLDMNRFLLVNGPDGPYSVFLGIDGDGKRLIFGVYDETGEQEIKTFQLLLTPFRRLIRDYFQICESYYDAIKKLSPSQIETIDMARRGLHNEGSDLLRERLKDKIEMDKATARRLFTIVCVLHIRS